jgi:hypothetical protein
MEISMGLFDSEPDEVPAAEHVIPASQPTPTSATPVKVVPPAPVVHGLTLEQFRNVLPDKVKKSLNQELIDRVNATLTNPEEFEHYRDNLISYTKVMQDGKFQIESYLYAVKYVSHKLTGCSNIEAYMKTFPDKYANFLATGVQAKDIASYVTAYNKGKLVNLIFEQTLIPVHVLNMDLYQRALNVQADLMMNAKSEKVRSDSANSLLVQLRPPEVKKLEMDITVKEGGAIQALRESTLALAEAQRKAIAGGAINAQEAAHSRLMIDMGDVETVEIGGR